MRPLRGRLLFVPAVMLTQAVYVVSAWFVAPFVRGQLEATPFVARLTAVYLLVLLLVYGLLRLAFWQRVGHLDDGRSLKILGVSPAALLRRTGVALVDVVGLLLAMLVIAVCAIIPVAQVLVPLAVLSALAFLAGLLAGDASEWQIRRRGGV